MGRVSVMDMDPSRALAELTQSSAHVEVAVIFDEDGTAVASTLDDEERAVRVAEAAARLLAEGPEGAVQLQAVLHDGAVFVVRDGGRGIVATTGDEPPIGLVMYDLRNCLRATAGSASAAA
jgi:predicted regulator of Ras-like GTPase activity (Roadblock/LC7/MglB family)